MKALVLFCAVALFSTLASAAVVEFHIQSGTGAKEWNTQATSIQGKVGDVLRFFNDDTISHRLHTFGAPCPHGPPIAAGTSWDCIATAPYSASTEGTLYDHNVGPTAKVWIEVTN